MNYLKQSRNIEREIIGIDIDEKALEEAVRNCVPSHTDFLLPREKGLKLEFYQGSVLGEIEDWYRGGKYDGLVCIEVMEHILKIHLPQLTKNIFYFIRPKIAIFSTPNFEFNYYFNSLRGGLFRHIDHKYEMTRYEFEKWANEAANQYGYRVYFSGVGAKPNNESYDAGFCTQIAIFEQLEINQNLPLPPAIPEEQNDNKLRKIGEHIFPVKKITTDPNEIKVMVLSEIDYFYRQYLLHQEDVEDIGFDAWVPIDVILLNNSEGFNLINKNVDLFVDIVKHSSPQHFELSADLKAIRGTEKYVLLNEETYDDEDYYDMEGSSQSIQVSSEYWSTTENWE